jgi:hypothetical protein
MQSLCFRSCPVTCGKNNKEGGRERRRKKVFAEAWNEKQVEKWSA